MANTGTATQLGPLRNWLGTVGRFVGSTGSQGRIDRGIQGPKEPPTIGRHRGGASEGGRLNEEGALLRVGRATRRAERDRRGSMSSQRFAAPWVVL